MPSIKLGLLHMAVQHKEPEHNRQQLFDLIREAGERGMQLIAAPELVISGYSFADIGDMEPYAETADGPTLTGVATLCRNYGMYACIGMAERDTNGAILYNSAFVVDPRGDIVCRYRKMNAEFRWACPGNPCDDNTFFTPWGRIGVLICSDSYHSLMPRVTALRGAKLLLVVANWPPVGGLDPVEIWRARALENGLYVAVCNRTGLDATMDCRKAPSAFISSQGAVQLNKAARTSRLVRVNVPLNRDGSLKGGQRLKRLANRNCERIQACYLNRAGISDLTSLLQLPQNGQLQLCCHSPDPTNGLHPTLAAIESSGRTAETLHILPSGTYEENDIDGLRFWCAATGQKAVLIRNSENGESLYWFDGKEPPRVRKWDSEQVGETGAYPAFDCGAARVHLVSGAALHHPELFIACAKMGADLIIVYARCFDEKHCLLAGARTIEQAAIVLCSPLGGGIWTPPEGHQRWGETLSVPGEHCTAILDTTKTRKKRFQDRIDYHTLLMDPQASMNDESIQALA